DAKAEETAYSNYSYWRSTFRSFRKNKIAVFLLVFVIVLIAFTFVQPYLPDQKSPTQIYLNPDTVMQDRNVAPNDEYIFGTNSNGQDLWSRIWEGTRTT